MRRPATTSAMRSRKSGPVPAPQTTRLATGAGVDARELLSECAIAPDGIDIAVDANVGDEVHRHRQTRLGCAKFTVHRGAACHQ